MKTKNLVLALIAVGFIGTGGYGAYWFGMNRGIQMAAPMSPGSTATPAAGAAPATGQADPATGRKILYWHDPMVPGQKFDKPGKSPFMDMPLVPVYAGADGDDGKVMISPRVQQNLGVRTAEVTKGSMTQKLEAIGSVAYNERDVAVVTARVGGYVERLYARAPLDPVRKGQPLAEMFAPEWVAAQEEYLSVRGMQGQRTEALLAAARQRMLLSGMNEQQVRLVESSGSVHPRFTLTAPVGGVIAELGAREGMTVMAGAMLFRINGLGSVWVNAEIPESRAALIRPSNAVEVRTPALPERVFKGRVAAILPEVNPATRTLKARVEVVNTGGSLAPGMFASVNFSPSTKADVLLVPSEAVIQTGERKVVIVAQEGGNFRPVDVQTGAEANGQTEIRKGLEAGQKVVVSGQFLIDSEASLKATTTRMSDAPMATETGVAQTHRGEGKVESIGKDEVTLSHGPIPSLQWGAMTMGFKAPANGLPKNIAVGDTVSFEIRQTKDGKFEITSIAPAAGPAQKPTASTTKDGMKGMKP
jgi:Cu(I)/Ag(I) efflux system membrane fusion protein